VEEQLGLHEEEVDNVTIVPDGGPEIESDTACVVPETKPTVTGKDTDFPAVTLPVLASESEKSKGTSAAAVVNVKFADASRDFTYCCMWFPPKDRIWFENGTLLVSC